MAPPARKRFAYHEPLDVGRDLEQAAGRTKANVWAAEAQRRSQGWVVPGDLPPSSG
jgi:hypothetical protein